MKDLGLGIIGFICLSLIVGAGMAGCPRYHVWSSQKRGEAELAKATANRQILIEEAQAKLTADSLYALAEVIRAKGAAQAMEAEGGSLTDMYIKYLWVRKLDLSRSKTIYLPTEAGIPITEAMRNLDE